MAEFARLLIFFGVVSIVLGMLVLFGAKIPLVGRLPGDLILRWGGTTIYAPLATSLVLSVAISVALHFLFPR